MHLLPSILLQALPGLALPVQAPAPPTDAPTPPVSSFWWGRLEPGAGLPDAIVLTPGLPARLLVNQGEGAFSDDSARAGLAQVRGATAALWQDVDGDGRQDILLIVPAGTSLLLLNRPGGTLLDVSAGSGLPVDTIHSARFVNLDDDGLPDLELVGPARDRLLRNLGDGRFEELDLGLPDRPAPALAGVSVDGERSGPVQPSAAEADDTRRRDASGARAGRGEAASGPTAGGFGSTNSRGPGTAAIFCTPSLLDQATGACLEASSVPTLGRLYPLSVDLNVDLAGRVGVGTTTNSHQLTVQSVGNDDALRLIGTQGSFGHGAKLNLGDGDFVHLWEYDDDSLEIKGNQIDVVAPSGVRFPLGNVGIGPTAPLWPLHVSATQAVARFDSSASSNGSVIELRNQTSGPSGIGAINFVNDAGQPNGQIAYSGADELKLRTGGQERMVVDGSGNVRFKGLEVTVGSGLVLPVARLLVAGVAELTSIGNLGLASPVVRAENVSTGDGVAVYGVTHGTDATTVFTQRGSGPIMRGFNGPESGSTLVFEVRKSGRVVTTALQITGGGDLVESFDTGAEVCEPGSVVVIDSERPGELKLSREPYDRRVAGVVSGAGGVKPGIELAQTGVLEGSTKVAMAGRVWVRCCAEGGPIAPGDLLTTASRAGHAMRVDDSARAFGAVIGKAMTGLESDAGLVLVLVNLQ